MTDRRQEALDEISKILEKCRDDLLKIRETNDAAPAMEIIIDGHFITIEYPWAPRKKKTKTYAKNIPKRPSVEETLEWCRQRLIEINQGKPCPVLKVIREGDHIRVVQIQPPWE